MICKKCGTENMPGSLFCMNCGAELGGDLEFGDPVSGAADENQEPDSEAPVPGTCPVCGAVNRIDAVFCMECGAEISGGSGSAEDRSDIIEEFDPMAFTAEQQSIGSDIIIEDSAPEPGVCPVCGAKNRPDALFCMECGADLIHKV